MRTLNFQKTAVWTLIVPNCWKILLQCFVSTHQQFHVSTLHLWFRHFNWMFDSFDINFGKEGELSEVQTALFLVVNQIKQTLVSYISAWSNVPWIKIKQQFPSVAAVFSPTQFQHSNSVENAKRNFQRAAVWTLTVNNSFKTLPPRKNFVPVFFFVLEADWETFSRPLPILLYCCKHTVMNRMKILRKTQVLAKNWNGFWWHRSLNFILWWLWTFARADFPTRVSLVKVSFWCSKFYFRARTVLYIKCTVDIGCL